jgi:hypothetical protein
MQNDVQNFVESTKNHNVKDEELNVFSNTSDANTAKDYYIDATVQESEEYRMSNK